jgi:hypothetical protein
VTVTNQSRRKNVVTLSWFKPDLGHAAELILAEVVLTR